ncbi:MAG TPA: hypothetical protein VN281_04740 [Verrucomicrobiae bacterium]|jgi:hypothetical protein|nr:hypothetical protein [Verrucomicrobiae bacterium]
MKAWPEFNSQGDLPRGIHRATLSEVISHFGRVEARRTVVARRLERIFQLAQSTKCVSRFIIFGSFVTAKAEPNDIDIFLLMDDSFDVRQVIPEARLVFDHGMAQNALGASIFWIRRQAALDGEEAAIAHWQIKRNRGWRGLVEVTAYD